MMLREAPQILLMIYLLESVDVQGVPAAVRERIYEAVTVEQWQKRISSKGAHSPLHKWLDVNTLIERS